MSDNARCQCPFLNHHHGPCSKEAAHAIGKASKLNLCRQCLRYLAGENRAVAIAEGPGRLEFSSRVVAGFRFG